MLYKKILTVLLVLLVSFSTLTAKGDSEKQGKDSDKLNINYWSSWSATENQALIMVDAAKAFEKLNPDVKINFTFNGRDNRNLVGSAMEAGTVIDVMDANIDNISTLWTDNISDLSSYYEKIYPTTENKKYKNYIMPSMLELTKISFNGDLKAIPYTPQGFFILCNKNIFDEAKITKYPTTWPELLEACEKIQDAGYVPITSDGYYATSWMGYYLSRLMGADFVYNLARNKELWNSPQVLVAAREFEKMAKLGYFDSKIASNQYPMAQQDMVIQENIGMYINGTWLPNEVSNTTTDQYKWGAFAYPTVENGVDGLEAGCYSAFGISINKEADQKVKDTAVDFAIYLTSGEWDKAFVDRANAIPMNPAADWPEALKDAKSIMNNLSTRYPSQTGLVTNSSSAQIIKDSCILLMAGEITAEQFVERASNF
jgi:raffinose/stachyose/melibiose transport system substrate-binding protein